MPSKTNVIYFSLQCISCSHRNSRWNLMPYKLIQIFNVFFLNVDYRLLSWLSCTDVDEKAWRFGSNMGHMYLSEVILLPSTERIVPIILTQVSEETIKAWNVYGDHALSSEILLLFPHCQLCSHFVRNMDSETCMYVCVKSATLPKAGFSTFLSTSKIFFFCK